MTDKKHLENDPDFPVHGNGAVLLSDEIERFANKYRMIDPFNSKNLKAASYYLTLGEECQQRGEPVTLSESNRYLQIMPYELAVLSTYETINLPRFIIGRWNLRVHMAYEGLLWVGGPQVDPGYQGKLHCPIYNLSNRPVILTYEDRIFTIDFVYTTPFDKSKCIQFKLGREDTLAAIDVHKIQSGLVGVAERSAGLEEHAEKISKETSETAKRVEETSRRIDTYTTIVFLVLAVVIAAVTIVAIAPFTPESPTWWNWQMATFGTSLLTLVLVIFTFGLVLRRRRRQQ